MYENVRCNYTFPRRTCLYENANKKLKTVSFYTIKDLNKMFFILRLIIFIFFLQACF